MKKRVNIGNFYMLLALMVIFLLLLGGFLLISNLHLKTEIEKNKNKTTLPESVSCESDQNCTDSSECTIDTCKDNVCLNTEIILCYNGDGCCPKSCNSLNDNDCLK